MVTLGSLHSFPDFFSTGFEVSISNLAYAFVRWHDMSSSSFVVFGVIFIFWRIFFFLPLSTIMDSVR